MWGGARGNLAMGAVPELERCASGSDEDFEAAASLLASNAPLCEHARSLMSGGCARDNGGRQRRGEGGSGSAGVIRGAARTSCLTLYCANEGGDHQGPGCKAVCFSVAPVADPQLRRVLRSAHCVLCKAARRGMVNWSSEAPSSTPQARASPPRRALLLGAAKAAMPSHIEDGGEPLVPELRQPLLQHQAPGGGGGEAAADAQPPCAGGGCSTLGGVANLVTTAVGAGMVALPKAVSETGILAGMALFALTAALTFASTGIIVRCAAGRCTPAAHAQRMHCKLLALLGLHPWRLSSPPLLPVVVPCRCCDHRVGTLHTCHPLHLPQVCLGGKGAHVWRACAAALWRRRRGAAAGSYCGARGGSHDW